MLQLVTNPVLHDREETGNLGAWSCPAEIPRVKHVHTRARTKKNRRTEIKNRRGQRFFFFFTVGRADHNRETSGNEDSKTGFTSSFLFALRPSNCWCACVQRLLAAARACRCTCSVEFDLCWALAHTRPSESFPLFSSLAFSSVTNVCKRTTGPL